MVDIYLELICISRLIFIFDYYFKYVILFYMWFINNIKMDKEIRDILRLKVIKGYRYIKYLCIVIEEDLEFD